MAWLKVITLLEFSQLMGMIDSLPSAAPRVCNQGEFVCGGEGENRAAEIRTKEGRKKKEKEICTSKKCLNEEKETSPLEAGSVLLAVPFADLESSGCAPALVSHLDGLSALK